MAMINTILTHLEKARRENLKTEVEFLRHLDGLRELARTMTRKQAERLERLDAKLERLQAHARPPVKKPEAELDGEGLLTTAQVARRLNVHSYTVGRWQREGKLPCVKLGALTRFRPADIDAFEAANERRPRPTRRKGSDL